MKGEAFELSFDFFNKQIFAEYRLYFKHCVKFERQRYGKRITTSRNKESERKDHL